MSALPAANRAPLSSVSRQVTSAVNLKEKNTYFVHAEVEANLINIPARRVSDPDPYPDGSALI